MKVKHKYEMQEQCPNCGEYVPLSLRANCGGNRLLHWVKIDEQ